MTKLDKKIEIRVSESEKNRIKFLADKFCDGNMSRWIVYAALNVARKKVKKYDLDLREAPQKRGT